MEQTIAAQVLRVLGIPLGMIKTDAIHLFNNYWRVNVWCRVQRETRGIRGTAKSLVPDNAITDSFFITVDAEGSIQTCQPELWPRYAAGATQESRLPAAVLV